MSKFVSMLVEMLIQVSLCQDLTPALSGLSVYSDFSAINKTLCELKERRSYFSYHGSSSKNGRIYVSVPVKLLRAAHLVDGLWGEAEEACFRDSLGGICCTGFCCAAGAGCLERGSNRVLAIDCGDVDDTDDL